MELWSSKRRKKKWKEFQLSLHSVVGFTSRRSLELWGVVIAGRVIVLIDGGEMQNFISHQLVKEFDFWVLKGLVKKQVLEVSMKMARCLCTFLFVL